MRSATSTRLPRGLTPCLGSEERSLCVPWSELHHLLSPTGPVPSRTPKLNRPRLGVRLRPIARLRSCCSPALKKEDPESSRPRRPDCRFPEFLCLPG